MKSHFNPTPGSTKRRPLAAKLFQFSSPPFWDRERLSASNLCLSARQDGEVLEAGKFSLVNTS